MPTHAVQLHPPRDEQGPMPLYLADIHLYRARLFQDRDALADPDHLVGGLQRFSGHVVSRDVRLLRAGHTREPPVRRQATDP